MATIQDVANRANVSPATVSRVLNGSAHVRSDLAERVQAAIQALQYRPSRAARALRAKRSTIIGLLISDIQNPFFTLLVRGVEDVAQRRGHSVILCNSDEDPAKERQYIEVLCAEQVAGAIVVPTRERHEAMQSFRDRRIPVVAVDRRLQGGDVDVVPVDNERGAQDAVAHLIDRGCRRIGLITGPLTVTTARERRDGYRRALRQAGLPLDPALERSGAFKAESGRRLADELCSLNEPLDALFATNNVLTLGALEALHARKLRIPNDIAIVGFDEMPWAALSFVSLTTVTQPVYELGSTAAARLFQRLDTPAMLTRQEIVLSPTLCVRDSSRFRLESLPA